MGKDAATPQAPNYKELIPLQTAANKDVFNYVLDASRANTTTPYGSSYWTKTPTFDQAGYDAALANWQKGSAGGGPQPGVIAPSPGSYGDNVLGPGTGAVTNLYGGGGPSGAEPTKDQFTSNQWTYNQTLSPEQQQLYQANVQSQLQQAQLLDALTGRVGEATSQPLDYSNLPALTGAVSSDMSGVNSYLGDLAQQSRGDNFNTTVSDALYNQALRYAEPDWQRQQSSLEARLAEQGFVPGTPAYAQAMQQQRQMTDLAKADARDRAIQAGVSAGNSQLGQKLAIAQTLLGAQGQGFGQRLAGAQFGNQARNQAIAEMLQKRQYPINELSAIRGGTQVTNPNIQPTYSTPNLSPVDIMGSAQQDYANQINAYNAQVGGQNDLFSNLIGLGALYFGGPMGAGLSGLFKGGGAGVITGGSGLRFPG